MNFRQFLIERTIRLAPLMVAGAAVGLAINGGSLWTLLMVPTGEFALYPANLPLWSLLFEFIAGAVFALFFRFGLIAWVIFAAIGLLGLTLGIMVTGKADLGFDWFTFPFGLARTAFDFCMGIAIYKMVERGEYQLPAQFLPVVLALPLAPMMLTGEGIASDLLIVTLVVPLCLWLGAVTSFQGVTLAAILGAPSYALYAVHHPIVNLPLSPLLTIPLVIALAMLLAWFYDPPIRRWLRNRIETRAVAAVVVQSGNESIR